MNIKEELLKEHSKHKTQEIADYIGLDSNKMAELMSLYSDSNQEIARRAAWVMSHVHDTFPTQTDSYQSLIIKTLKSHEVHDAVKRAGLRSLADKTIAEEYLGEAAEICFELLKSKEEAIAVKVHAMEILKNIVIGVPELREELLFSLEEQFPYQTSGFKSRASKIIAFLQKMK